MVWCVWVHACVFISNHQPLTGVTVWFRCVSVSLRLPPHSLRQTETQQRSLMTARQHKHLLAPWPSSHGGRELKIVQSPSNCSQSDVLLSVTLMYLSVNYYHNY